MESQDGHWYEADKDGNIIKDSEGKATKVDSDLKSTAKKVWDGAKNTAYDLKDRISGSFSDESIDKSSNGSNKNSNHSVGEHQSNHGKSFNSNIHNDSISEKSMQALDSGGWGGRVMGAAKFAASALIDGTPFNPTSMGGSADELKDIQRRFTAQTQQQRITIERWEEI